MHAQTYGTNSYAHHMPKAMVSQSQRRAANTRVLIWSLLAPVALFAAISAVQSFGFRFQHASLCWLFLAAALLLVGFVALRALRALRAARAPAAEGGNKMPAPAWYVFYAASMAIALSAGFVLADANFWNNARPYAELQNLSRYTKVAPATTSGLQLMDAGEVVFTSDATLNVNHTMSFKNVIRYCVAPIVSADSKSSSAVTTDLWAVGTNCCTVDFKCGAYNNAKAHSGLRSVNKEHADYYLLAVKQAEAAYGLKAPHPVFFYWVEDAGAEAAIYLEEGWLFYVYGLVAFVCYQIVAVVLATVAFRKLGVE